MKDFFIYDKELKNIDQSDLGKKFTLCGFVSQVRDLGHLVFIDLRQENYFLQLNIAKEFYQKASLESVIQVEGILSKKEENNEKIKNGDLELIVESMIILSLAQTPPFLPNKEAKEELKLKYRYLELRNKQSFLKFRSDLSLKIRQFFHQEHFTEIETPLLYKSTPEGSRDYVVPSRIHPGHFYALPQSPQTLKQLLMISDFSKYFQICKCFRDEDLRSDRQPEFTQIDFEVSYPEVSFFKKFNEKLFSFLLNQDITFEELSYDDAIKFYGSDKPDLRFDLKFQDLPSHDFDQIKPLSRCLFLDSSYSLSRKEIDDLCGKKIYWFKVENKLLSGGIAKFIKGQELKSGLYFIGEAQDLHSLRKFFAHKFNLYKRDYSFLWIYDFPLFEEGEEGIQAKHHPFTRVQRDQLDDFFENKNLLNLKADAYDLVCNGYELGGGSLRIFSEQEQYHLFKILKLSDENIKNQFGFFLEAFKYGVPPHGGMALGFDRICMILQQTDNIRDVIAFPKTTSATDLMSETPSKISSEQLKTVHLSLDIK